MRNTMNVFVACRFGICSLIFTFYFSFLCHSVNLQNLNHERIKVTKYTFVSKVLELVEKII